MKPLVVPPRRGRCEESGRRGGEERDGAGGGTRPGWGHLASCPREWDRPREHRSPPNNTGASGIRMHGGAPGTGMGSGQGRDRCWAGGEAQSHPTALLFQLLWPPPTPSPRCQCPGSPTLGVPSWLRGGLKAQCGAVPRGCGSPDPVCLTGGAAGQLPLLTVAKFSAGKSQDPLGSLSRAHPIHQGGSSTQG